MIYLADNKWSKIIMYYCQHLCVFVCLICSYTWNFIILYIYIYCDKWRKVSSVKQMGNFLKKWIWQMGENPLPFLVPSLSHYAFSFFFTNVFYVNKLSQHNSLVIIGIGNNAASPEKKVSPSISSEEGIKPFYQSHTSFTHSFQTTCIYLSLSVPKLVYHSLILLLCSVY